jgi:AcrR family transcriptional regulator
MLKPDTENQKRRRPLSRERVLRVAMAIADADGIEALTIRSLAHELGVKPMAIYYHVANKSEILDSIVDLVFAEIELPATDGDWRSEIVRRANSARRVLSRHRWAIGLMESRRSPGAATLRHHDAVIATLRRAGLSVEMTAHAYALLDSYVYGFALQEAALPFQGTDTAADVTEPIMERFRSDQYPHLVEMATEYILQPGYDFGDEFEFGLGVILDALTRSLPRDSPGIQPPHSEAGLPQSGSTLP